MIFPLTIKVEEAAGKIELSNENRLICPMSITKTQGDGQVVLHAADEHVDLMEQIRTQMRDVIYCKRCIGGITMLIITKNGKMRFY